MTEPTGWPPIQIHPRSPYCFLWRDRTTVLVSSSEHYGAVINADFDYVAYLDALAAHGMNYTRIYPGSYFETDGQFVEDNPLGPRDGRHCLPWARSDRPGYPLGGNLFDLDRWDPEYVARLRDFVRVAAERAVVVEICLFNGMYESSWPLMPLNAANNVQGVGTAECVDVQTLRDEPLVRYQEAYVRKIVQETQDYDNVIYEIVDEPGITGLREHEYRPWIDRMIDAVRAEQAGREHRHLVAQQICGVIGGDGDFSTDPRVDIATGQYVWEIDGGQLGGMRLLDSVYHHGKLIEFNESSYYPGFFQQSPEEAAGPVDRIGCVRAEAWEFIVGGGGAYNHLNAYYSTANPAAAGVGNEELLTSLRSLQEFLRPLELAPMRRTYLSGGFRTGMIARCIAEPGRQYALYLHHSVLSGGERYTPVSGDYVDTVRLLLEPGTYRLQWVEPATARVLADEELVVTGRMTTITSPRHGFDIAARIIAAS